MSSLFATNQLISKDGPVSNSSLDNKTVGIYFSAHWCGPCRSFTPALRKKYQELIADGKQLEIVFVSSDRDEESAASYFKEMPWLMLDFAERDAKAALSSKFNVRGIPTLVLVDAKGETITTQGREAIMEMEFDSIATTMAERLAEKTRIVKPSQLFAGNLESHDGPIDSTVLDSAKVVAIYFSAHWCPPCRSFTPLLSKKYKELVASGCSIEIIFASADNSLEEAKEYYSEMPWKMMKFEAKELAAKLDNKYDIQGIPTLVLLDETGKLITDEGRNVLMTVPFDQLHRFEAFMEEKEAKMKAAIAVLPSEVTIDAHPHPLVKTASVYRGSYGCDVCGNGGSGFVYHCDECKYDCHIECAVDINAFVTN